MFVFYDNGKDIIVTTRKREKQMLQEYLNGTGRNISDSGYERKSFSGSSIRIVYHAESTESRIQVR